jgi:hypothetical protein
MVKLLTLDPEDGSDVPPKRRFISPGYVALYIPDRIKLPVHDLFLQSPGKY